MLINERFLIKNITPREGVPTSIRLNKRLLSGVYFAMEENKAQIYALKDPSTLEIRYIGKTIQPLHKRLLRHIQDAKNGLTTPDKDEWIVEVINSGKSIVIECLEICDKSQSAERETAWIRKCNKEFPNLLNNLGGVVCNTPKNRIAQQEMTKIRRDKFIGNKYASRIQSQEQKDKRSASLKECYRLGLRRRCGVDLGTCNIIPIVQLTLTGDIIQEYESTTHASKVTGLKRTAITENVRGKNKTCGGYIFKRMSK